MRDTGRLNSSELNYITIRICEFHTLRLFDVETKATCLTFVVFESHRREQCLLLVKFSEMFHGPDDTACRASCLAILVRAVIICSHFVRPRRSIRQDVALGAIPLCEVARHGGASSMRGVVRVVTLFTSRFKHMEINVSLICIPAKPDEDVKLRMQPKLPCRQVHLWPKALRSQ